ncbi:MAG TPA: NADH-quinone oxidoreductase subunit NuoN [Candidatus Obscuribacterales bacterium]
MNYTPEIYLHALKLMGPEIVLVVAIVFAALWNICSPRQRAMTPVVSIGLIIVATLMLAQQFSLPRQMLFPTPDGAAGLFTVDKLTAAFGLMSCIFGGMVVLMTMGYEFHFKQNRGEYYALLLTSVLAVILAAGSTDLVMLFVSLETLTLAGVLLSGFAKRDRRSNEASLKYLLSTAATTATFLYGLSFLYGLGYSTNYYEIASALAVKAQSPSIAVVLVLILMLSIIGFKLSLVPFHMWTPDVYEGAPTPVSAYLSVISKMGGLVVAIRVLDGIFGASVAQWAPIVAILAMLSMIAGNFIALAQTSLKRMLAYSSIAHVGYMLIGLVANTGDGLAAMVFYMIVYGFMNLGAFTGAVLFENETGSDNIEDMAGLIRKRPWLAVGLSICLLNLGGLPVPPAGFLAKVFVFWAGFQMATPLGYWLVAIALLTSVPALYYYTRVVIMMAVRDPSEKVATLPEDRHLVPESAAPTNLALMIAVAGVVVGTLAVNPLMTFSGQSVAGMGRPMTNVGTLPNSEAR